MSNRKLISGTKLVKIFKKMLSLHGGFLTNECILTEKQYNLMKWAHDSQIVRDKQNLRLSHGGPSLKHESRRKLFYVSAIMRLV